MSDPFKGDVESANAWRRGREEAQEREAAESRVSPKTLILALVGMAIFSLVVALLIFYGPEGEREPGCRYDAPSDTYICTPSR